MSRYGYKQKNKINGGKYYWQLQDWVNKLFMKYDRCVICGSKGNLEPHHVNQVKPYDKSYADINNGVVMCKSCHRKYHEKYMGDINTFSLLLFMRDSIKGKGGLNNAQLTKKLKQSNKVLKYYQEENLRLRKELNELKNNGVEKEERL